MNAYEYKVHVYSIYVCVCVCHIYNMSYMYPSDDDGICITRNSTSEEISPPL